MVARGVEAGSRAETVGIQPEDVLVHIGHSGNLIPIRILQLVSTHVSVQKTILTLSLRSTQRTKVITVMRTMWDELRSHGILVLLIWSPRSNTQRRLRMPMKTATQSRRLKRAPPRASWSLTVRRVEVRGSGAARR